MAEISRHPRTEKDVINALAFVLAFAAIMALAATDFKQDTCKMVFAVAVVLAVWLALRLCFP